MTEFWVSVPKKWCDMCEVFYRGNEEKKHVASTKHKRQMERKQRMARVGGSGDDRVDRELARMEQLAGRAVARDVVQGRAGNHELITEKKFALPPRPPSRGNEGRSLNTTYQQGANSQSAFKPYVPSSDVLEQRRQEAEVAALWKREEEEEGDQGDQGDAEHPADEDEEDEEAAALRAELEEARRIEEEAARFEEERLRREAKVKAESYDPLNPFGSWVEASPPREPAGREPVKGEEDEEPDDIGQFRTRKQIREEDEERFEEDVEADTGEPFIVERKVALDRVYNDAVFQDGDDDNGNDGEVVFKSRGGKQRNARKKAKRDLNDE